MVIAVAMVMVVGGKVVGIVVGGGVAAAVFRLLCLSALEPRSAASASTPNLLDSSSSEESAEATPGHPGKMMGMGGIVIPTDIRSKLRKTGNRLPGVGSASPPPTDSTTPVPPPPSETPNSATGTGVPATPGQMIGLGGGFVLPPGDLRSILRKTGSAVMSPRNNLISSPKPAPGTPVLASLSPLSPSSSTGTLLTTSSSSPSSSSPHPQTDFRGLLKKHVQSQSPSCSSPLPAGSVATPATATSTGDAVTSPLNCTVPPHPKEAPSFRNVLHSAGHPLPS